MRKSSGLLRDIKTGGKALILSLVFDESYKIGFPFNALKKGGKDN